MDMMFDIFQISEENKDCFVPKKGHLSNFENWAMIKAYCQLHYQVKKIYESEHELQGKCVWNGNELYNTEHQITNDDGNSCLWLTENNILMLEVYYDDDRPNKLFRCD